MTLRTHTIKKKDESKNQVWEWEETPELLDRVIESISNLSSSDGNKLSSDKLELLRNFIINIDYYTYYFNLYSW